MSFEFTNLRRLGDQVNVSIPTDPEGYMGRECPSADCEGYFKVKPATGLSGTDLPCHCPYCGQKDSTQRFCTKEQIEYAKSVLLREVASAIFSDLKKLEFNHKPRGPFGLGISMTVKEGAPIPIRHYREKELETKVICAGCLLEYSVFGVFAYCPDCGVHNSLQILQKNIGLTQRQLQLSETVTDVDLKHHLVEDALENCVSAFDGFAREACRVRADKSANPSECATLSFQNLPRGAGRLRALFGIELSEAVEPSEWTFAHVAFMQRHLLAHKSGVIDQRYLDETGQSPSLLGRRLNVS
jgi:hypothetical protein